MSDAKKLLALGKLFKKDDKEEDDVQLKEGVKLKEDVRLEED
jgi:hypothetical protein